VSPGTFNAPAETDSWMLDVNFATKSFQVFAQYFNFEGHIEFIAPRENEFGDEVTWHIFGQPQFRWDVGYALFGHTRSGFISSARSKLTRAPSKGSACGDFDFEVR